MQVNMRVVLIVVAVICAALAIYYLIPGIYHPLTFSPPNESHKTHALAFGAVAVLSLIASRFARSSAQRP